MSAILRTLAEQVAAEAEALKLDEVNAHVHLGNPDLVIHPENNAIVAFGTIGSRSGEPTQRGDVRANRGHDSRA